jgi:hypothetical protein
MKILRILNSLNNYLKFFSLASYDLLKTKSSKISHNIDKYDIF